VCSAIEQINPVKPHASANAKLNGICGRPSYTMWIQFASICVRNSIPFHTHTHTHSHLHNWTLLTMRMTIRKTQYAVCNIRTMQVTADGCKSGNVTGNAEHLTWLHSIRKRLSLDLRLTKGKFANVIFTSIFYSNWSHPLAQASFNCLLTLCLVALCLRGPSNVFACLYTQLFLKQVLNI